MAYPLLKTKLHIPNLRPSLVPRPRLIERLNQGLQAGGKLTLVSAPAGFGKSTVVSEWIAACGRPVAWLSLDERDSDWVRFISYLVAALQTIQAGVGEDFLAALHSPEVPSAEAILTALLNEIATIQGCFALILDDYHVIDSPAVDQALAFIIEYQPQHMHLVIATREDPHLPLARLRARGQLTELRAADLRFTPTEAAEFLTRMMNLPLSEQEVATLDARTEGWIAGLQMAALALQSLALQEHSDNARFIQSFSGSHRFVLDYLMEEVLEHQTSEVQTFLLHTSILERLCGPLCDAVLGSSSARGQEILKDLDRANLFLTPLDNERRWYRYHHLFGDLLRQRLGKSAELPALHLRASRWYEENDDLSAAFHHALAASDFERAASLTETAWQGMERSFQPTAWLGWVQKLPPAVVSSRPWLCVQMGWAYSDVGELEASETSLQAAERALAEMQEMEAFKALPGTVALIRAGNAQIEGNLAETVRYAELSVQLAPEDDRLTRAQAAITLGFTQWAVGKVEASLKAMRTWMDDMQKMGNHMYVIASAFVVADMLVGLGQLGEAEKALQQTIQKAEAFGQEAEVVTAHHHLGLAMLAHERGDDDVVAQRLQTVADLGQHTTLIDWPYRWGLAQARLKKSAGEWEAALKSLDEAQRGYIKNPIPILQPVDAHKARVALKQGRLDMAQAWVRERALSVMDEASYMGEYEYLTLARVRLAERSFEGVGPLLERLLALAETQERTGSVIEILLTQALFYQLQGNQPQALAALKHALTLAEPEGYLRIFVDEGEAMQLLISDFQHLRRAKPLLGYIDRILAYFPQPVNDELQYLHRAQVQVSKIQNPKSRNFVEPLSERELEVLKLLRSELSGPEMAERLIVSLNTLRTHTKNIFNKLGVNNRRAAVRRAEELDLF